MRTWLDYLVRQGHGSVAILKIKTILVVSLLLVEVNSNKVDCLFSTVVGYLVELNSSMEVGCLEQHLFSRELVELNSSMEVSCLVQYREVGYLVEVNSSMEVGCLGQHLFSRVVGCLVELNSSMEVGCLEQHLFSREAECLV